MGSFLFLSGATFSLSLSLGLLCSIPTFDTVNSISRFYTSKMIEENGVPTELNSVRIKIHRTRSAICGDIRVMNFNLRVRLTES